MSASPLRRRPPPAREPSFSEILLQQLWQCCSTTREEPALPAAFRRRRPATRDGLAPPPRLRPAADSAPGEPARRRGSEPERRAAPRVQPPRASPLVHISIPLPYSGLAGAKPAVVLPSEFEETAYEQPTPLSPARGAAAISFEDEDGPKRRGKASTIFGNGVEDGSPVDGCGL